MSKEPTQHVIRALRKHPQVHMVWRQNSGVFKNPDGNHFRFGTPGMADVGGVLKDGAYFAIECKSKGDKPNDNQDKWLAYLARNGNVCGVAWSVQDALNIIETRWTYDGKKLQ